MQKECTMLVSHCSFLEHQLETDVFKKKKVCAITLTMLSL